MSSYYSPNCTGACFAHALPAWFVDCTERRQSGNDAHLRTGGSKIEGWNTASNVVKSLIYGEKVNGSHRKMLFWAIYGDTIHYSHLSQKMNAGCAHILDVNRSNKMDIKFYDMCTTSGEDWSKAETLFNAIDSTFVKDDLSWTHCVSVGLDNTNGNMGNRNSVKSRVLQKNASCFIAGCSCHLAHIPAKKGGSAYSQTSKCDIEDHMVDLYYYFKGSTRRKGSLTEVLDFSGMVWESLGKYVTTRWLSLEQCADKEVKKVPALHSMVMTRDARTGQQDNGRNGDEDEEPIMRGKRLEKAVSDPMTEVDIAFYVSALSLSSQDWNEIFTT